MLARSFYSLSRGAMRATPLITQLPAMNYTVDMRVREEMKMVFSFFTRWSYFVALLQALQDLSFQSLKGC